MVNLSDTKIRWFLRLCLVIVGILARREIGINQHLRVMRGEDRVSVAKESVKWCQVEDEWGNMEKSLRNDIRIEKRTEVAHRRWGRSIHGRGMEMAVKSRIDIINSFIRLNQAHRLFTQIRGLLAE